jgi:hypothetical protein
LRRGSLLITHSHRCVCSIDQFKNPNYYYNVENWLRSAKISLNQLQGVFFNQGVFLFGTLCRIWRYLGCAKANRKFRHKNPLNHHSTRAAEPALVRIGGEHVPCFSMLLRYRTVMHSEATLSPAPFPSGESHGSDSFQWQERPERLPRSAFGLILLQRGEYDATRPRLETRPIGSK